MARADDQDGQASVELVALLPLIGVLAAIAWQAVVAGQAVWLTAGAARAAARAGALGQDADRAARAVLPGRLRSGVRVEVVGGGAARVRVRIPLVLTGAQLAGVSSAARFAPQR